MVASDGGSELISEPLAVPPARNAYPGIDESGAEASVRQVLSFFMAVGGAGRGGEGSGGERWRGEKEGEAGGGKPGGGKPGGRKGMLHVLCHTTSFKS